jgi:hypothetical protein
MKKLVLIVISTLCLYGLQAQEKAKSKTKKTEKEKPAKELKDCGEYNGHKLYKGAKGGCYYKDKSAKTKKINKVYVEGNLCNC